MPDSVLVLPNNKNIVAVAQQVDDLTERDVGVVPTHAVVEALAALVAYDPDATLADNERTMADAASRVRAGEVTQAVRDSAAECGPIAKGDWIAVTRDGIGVTAGDRGRRGDRAGRPARRRRQRARRPCSWAPSAAADATNGCASTSGSSIRTSRSKCTRATSRSTRTSSASNSERAALESGSASGATQSEDLVSESPRGHHLARAAATGRHRARAVGPKLADRLGEMGIATVLDLLEHYPRRYHDRTHTEDIANLAVGEEATVAGEVKKVTRRSAPTAAGRSSRSRCSTARRTCGSRSSTSRTARTSPKAPRSRSSARSTSTAAAAR